VFQHVRYRFLNDRHRDVAHVRSYRARATPHVEGEREFALRREALRCLLDRGHQIGRFPACAHSDEGLPRLAARAFGQLQNLFQPLRDSMWRRLYVRQQGSELQGDAGDVL
jgi:hypothetical protein